jgi:ribonuclease BN (tRNA processing enzyme)
MIPPASVEYPDRRDVATIAARLQGRTRVLLVGPPGIGKSTLGAEVAAWRVNQGLDCRSVSADPGTPAFGPPGAVSLGIWQNGAWLLEDLEPLCSLDAARYRLPLVQAVERLLKRAPPGLVLVDAPGVVRGVAGAELLAGLVAAAAIDLILVLERAGPPLPLEQELATLDVAICRVPAAAAAHAPNDRVRARLRTAAWNAYLERAAQHRLDLEALRCVGMPPPRGASSAWVGRQIALLRGAQFSAFGEIVSVEGTTAHVRLRGEESVGAALAATTAVLVRDAQRAHDGLLGTAKPLAVSRRDIGADEETARRQRLALGGPAPTVPMGPFTATLVNGVWGDPLLHVRLRHAKRSLLFDLGEAGRLPVRIAHQVTDVFVSHAHIDHIAGFLWFLRSRIGEYAPCRIFGPAGLAANIAGLVAGIHWDRVGPRGPCFDVAELRNQRLARFRVQAGEQGARALREEAAADGTLLASPSFRVRAVTLDHKTPVLAFALEASLEIKVRKERLAALAVAPGPWLTELKTAVAAHEREQSITLPSGAREPVGALADELLLIEPGHKLVYATDLADTAENRARLAAFAAGAHVFFCEATFCEADAERAASTGHLTAKACAEIATAARVQRLVPFHFSRRYEPDASQLYHEIGAVGTAATIVIASG